MNQTDPFTAQFEANRPRLRALAYRMLGSFAEADDAVQEAWLRFDRADPASVDNLGGWLTTVTSRLCLDRLRARQSRHEGFGDPDAVLVDAPGGDGDDPEEQAELADSVGWAMLAVLDRLAPAERVAFVLHDVFAIPFDQISDVLGRSPDATRQLASRARRRVRGTPVTSALDLERQRAVVAAFLTAARGGGLDDLLALLDPDVALRPDATARRSGLEPVRGAAAVARYASGGLRGTRLALVGGAAGLAWAPAGRVRGALEFTVVDGRIVAIDAIADPETLRRLDVVLEG